MTRSQPYHPAKFSDAILREIGELVRPCKNLLDPMAGTGKIALIRDAGFAGRITCNDLEPEWADPAYPVDRWTFCDAAHLPFVDGEFDCIATSPTYGNRLADHHDARDGSKRYSYKFCLGKDLHPENTGQMQWGDNYRDKHVEIYKECYRVLGVNGIFVLNMSNHVRGGYVINVAGWTFATLLKVGFFPLQNYYIKTPRMRNGANGNARVGFENLFFMIKIRCS